MIELCNEMNPTILRGGLRSCPAVVRHSSGALKKIGGRCATNAGHTAGLLRDNAGITPLEANGLPLGLFSHTMQSAASCHLISGSALLVVSRGIVEADYVDADHQATEFGLDGVKQSFQNATALNASELCMTVLQAARKFIPTTSTHNDLTTLVLVGTASGDHDAV